MKKPLLILFSLCSSITIFAQNCNFSNNEPAKKHWYRADGLMQAAQEYKDYQLAIDEFQEASKYAPNCPDIYYYMGVCYEQLCRLNTNNCDKAISAYRNYLELNPKANDKEQIEGKIYYSIPAQKEKYNRDLQEAERKKQAAKEAEMQKYVGRWKVHSWNSFHKRYYEYDKPFNIYISNGRLYVNTGMCNETVYNDFKQGPQGGDRGYGHIAVETSRRCTNDNIVTVSIKDNGSISFAFTKIDKHKGFVNKQGIFVTGVEQTHSFSYSYELHFVSPTRLEGQETYKFNVPDYVHSGSTGACYLEKY